MPLDHSKATATIDFSGLALICINSRKRNRCEVSFLDCERHTPALDIQKVTLSPATGAAISSSVVSHSLNLAETISIQVVRPAASGVRGYKNERIDFKRRQERGDEEDFRWVVDLEGEEFHDQRLSVKDPSKLGARVVISDGVLYTKVRTQEQFARVSVDSDPPPKFLGKLAYKISTDIECFDGGEIVLTDESRGASGREAVVLRKTPNTRYVISIDSECDRRGDFEGTDFRLFYDVLHDPEGEMFDLRRVVNTGGRLKAEAPIADEVDFSLDGFPQTCLAVLLGETTHLPDDPTT